MKTVFIAACTLVAWSAGAHAFWQRSHWAACNEAPSPGERARLQCHVYDPVPDWPLLSVPARPGREFGLQRRPRK